jgi:hypothetical protein
MKWASRRMTRKARGRAIEYFLLVLCGLRANFYLLLLNNFWGLRAILFGNV